MITSGRSFDALSIYYNDLSYNRYTIDGPRTAINDSIYKIEVYTVENFDASHPAGSDISDLIECRYISYYDYIQSGYKKEENKQNIHTFDNQNLQIISITLISIHKLYFFDKHILQQSMLV